MDYLENKISPQELNKEVGEFCKEYKKEFITGGKLSKISTFLYKSFFIEDHSFAAISVSFLIWFVSFIVAFFFV